MSNSFVDVSEADFADLLENFEAVDDGAGPDLVLGRLS